MLTRRTALAGLAMPLLSRRASAQAAPIRIGILQDASGPYSYLGGQGSVACARQAAAEVTPEDSRSEWDLYAVKAKLGPDQAWRPMAEGGCPMVRT